jgi:SAM-dependent methyltransferase
MTKVNRITKEQALHLSASRSVKRFGRDIVTGAAGAPILDAPCGTGRNSAWISYIGGEVIGLDIDLGGIKKKRSEGSVPPFGRAFRRIKLIEKDLLNDPWPYPPLSLGGLINVHFLHMPLLSQFSQSIRAGGLLILETVEARGGNYHQLPEARRIYDTLRGSFSFLIYKERSAGLAGTSAVTVNLVGRKLALPREWPRPR